MKTFITKNWEKILITIGSVFIAYILYIKIATPKTLIADYIKYGKNMEPISSKITGINGDGTIYSKFFNSNPELVKLALIMIVGILAVVVLTTIASNAGQKKDAKKK